MKAKRITLTITLFILSLTYKAQDKYEFMTISYETFYHDLVVCVDGKEIIAEEIKLEKAEKGILNCNPLLKKISEYQQQDWEVVTFNTSGLTVGSGTRLLYVAFLRKKKNEKK
ncbi:MAG: hypothetical protein V4635_05970 [Bacteroidota bacterium]